MARHSGPVLLDNNAIGAAVDTETWAALSGGYSLETVTEVAEEAGTYFRKLCNHQVIQQSFNARVTIRDVTSSERANLLAKLDGIALDDGERDLWAHAIARDDQWILCGPDKASMRTALRLGLRDRMVSLEWLLKNLGVQPKNLPRHYGENWLQQTFAELAILELRP